MLDGLDLRDAVLVGHSMGGVAVQAFVIRYPEIAAERVRGIVLLSTLAYTPFGSRSTQMKARIGSIVQPRARLEVLVGAQEPRVPRRALGFGKDPQPSHVELVRRMMLECPPDTRRDAPRVLVGLDLTEDLPDDADPDARRSAAPPTC